MTEQAKSMLDDINEDLSDMGQTFGVQKIAQLIADRWDIPQAEVAPYLTAVALQIIVSMDALLLTDPAECFNRANNTLYNATRAAVAAEKIGWYQMRDNGLKLGEYATATELAANTFANTDEPSTTTH